MEEAILSRTATLKAEGRLILALMLRDIKTRFGGTEWGFLLAIAWPLSHVLILLTFYHYAGRAAPYGDSVALWFATGVIPFMAFSYMSRFIMISVAVNKPLLSFPIVKVTDILFARAVLEVLSAGLVVLILFIVFWAVGVDFVPRDIVQAGLAMLAMMFLGMGNGIVSAVIAAAFPFWLSFYSLIVLLLWLASGVIFVPDALPESFRVPLSYVPTLQGVEWMRSAYYEDYGATVLDKGYLLFFATVTLFFGLGLERMVRGKLR